MKVGYGKKLLGSLSSTCNYFKGSRFKEECYFVVFSSSFPFKKSVTQLEIIKIIFCWNTGNRIVALIPSPIGFDRLRNMLLVVLLTLAKNAEIMVLLFTLNLVRNPQ